MDIPVKAKRNLDAFIPDTEIVVKIPAGTEGNIVRELRTGIVIVQFNVPSLGGLRVDLNELEVQDKFELVITQMSGMYGGDISDKVELHKEIDKILIRAIRILADDSAKEKVDKLVSEYQKAIRWLYSRRDKEEKD